MAVHHVTNAQGHAVCCVIQLDFFPVGIELPDGLVVGNGNAPIARVTADVARGNREYLDAFGSLERLPQAFYPQPKFIGGGGYAGFPVEQDVARWGEL